MAIGWRLERQETLEEAESLRLLIQDTESSLLAFALYRSASEREAAVRFLKERLTLPVVEFALSPQQKNPVHLLQTLNQPKRLCTFFYDAEEALPELAGYVNLQREAFAQVPHAVIFWVREYGLREIANHAPDFWAWRSGVFDFRSETVERLIPAIQTALAEPILFTDKGDLERRISLYEGLVREYSQQESPLEHFLGRLQVKLASAYYLLRRFEQAESSACQALERSRRAGDQQVEAATLHMLGILAQERFRLEEAEEKYKQSLAIEEQLGDLRGKGATLHQMAGIYVVRGDLDGAMKLYQEARAIQEQLGDLRGKGATLAMMGQVLVLQGQREVALRAFLEAHSTLAGMGAAADAAKVAGSIQVFRNEIGDAAFLELWQRLTGQGELPDWLRKG